MKPETLPLFHENDRALSLAIRRRAKDLLYLA
jgi:hypothetical protein